MARAGHFYFTPQCATARKAQPPWDQAQKAKARPQAWYEPSHDIPLSSDIMAGSELWLLAWEQLYPISLRLDARKKAPAFHRNGTGEPRLGLFPFTAQNIIVGEAIGR